jgi:ribulose 1,5-bisphosphate synthetase/thiazole synthase
MKQIKEPPKAIDVLAETDILVVGSGPAGLAAAVSAAREGVKTMLVDRYGCFGGVITQVGVGTMAWYRYEGTVDTQGIGIEFEQRAKEMGASQALRNALKRWGPARPYPRPAAKSWMRRCSSTWPTK